MLFVIMVCLTVLLVRGDRHESEDVNQSHSGAEEAVLCLNKLREKLDVQSCIEVS
jgi:hypothetical protein